MSITLSARLKKPKRKIFTAARSQSVVKHECFQGRHRHALDVDWVEARNPIPDDDQSIEEPTKVRIAVPSIGRERIMFDVRGDLSMVVEKVLHLRDQKARCGFYESRGICWGMVTVDAMHAHYPAVSFDGRSHATACVRWERRDEKRS